MNNEKDEHFPLGAPVNRNAGNPVAPQDRWKESTRHPGFLENAKGQLATKPKPLAVTPENVAACMASLMRATGGEWEKL